MDKYTGIDVSKATFDVGFCDGEGNWHWKKLENCTKGFRQLLKFVPSDHTLVMEASGPYYMRLATFLHGQGRVVCVINPLQIRRFSQMRLYRAKTDRKDARVIAEYATANSPKNWEPNDPAIQRMQQVVTALEGINKQLGIATQQLEAFEATGAIDPYLRDCQRKMVKQLGQHKSRLEERLSQLVREHYPDTMEQLTSIPGIGPKAATMLICITNNFQKFDHYKQLIAYVGFSPRIFQSGTSVNGKGHICKMGKSQTRKILYMCTWTAKFCNEGCRSMYERLKAKGKPERVIKIAIANKLLKQAFAVVTKNQPYEKNYQPKTCF